MERITPTTRELTERDILILGDHFDANADPNLMISLSDAVQAEIEMYSLRKDNVP